MSALVATGFSSCSDDLNEPGINGTSSSMLVAKPKMTAYSGNHIWNSSATRGYSELSEEFSDVVSYETVWKDYGVIDYNAEGQVIREMLQEGQNNGSTLDKDFMYHAEEDITFEMFPVFQSTSHSPNYLGLFFYDSKGELHQEIIWDNINLYNFNDWQNNNGRSRGIRITVKKGYKFGFFIEGTDNSYQNLSYYSYSELNPEMDIFGGEGTSKVHAGTFERNGETYLCFEDWTDFDYQDLIFASFTSLPTVDEDDLLPDLPDRPELPDGPTTGGDSDVDNGGDGDDTGSSDADVANKGFNEVEINLSLDDKNNRYLESHLSLHVRHATDVEVFIPVPAKYYCEADDMNIVLDKAEAFVHGGPYTTEYNIGGNMVYLNVEFKEGGIRVYTDGVNQSVIDYCREHYNDGVTFEVWNYFNDPEKVGDLPITMEELKTYMDHATVRFLDEIPDTYVNAFGRENGKYGVNGNRDGKDFHVLPVDQSGSFADPVEGTHLNGSDINDIYKAKK